MNCLPSRCEDCNVLLADQKSRWCRSCWGRRNKGVKIADPTPDEIAARCQQVRSSWSQDEVVERLRPDWRPVGWQLRSVSMPMTERLFSVVEDVDE